VGQLSSISWAASNIAAIQLDGGIVLSIKGKAGNYFSRLPIIDQPLGDPEHRLGMLASRGSLFAIERNRLAKQA
jgi:hypothetical protein